MRLLLLIVPLFLSSCFLFRNKFTRDTFSYTNEQGVQQVPIIIPKGYTSRRETTDSAGNSGILYGFGKSIFYVSYVKDTMVQTQPIDTSLNIPRLHPLGGLIYKGINDKGLFWREIRRQHLRFGYRDVSSANEIAFDSATNYSSGLRPK